MVHKVLFKVGFWPFFPGLIVLIPFLCFFQNKNLYGIEHGPQFNSLELLLEAYHSGVVDGADFSLKKACPF